MKKLLVIGTFLFIILFFGWLLQTLLFNTKTTADIANENNAYTRIVACFASTSPTNRTPEYVKACYAEAEQHTGITVKRFGDGR